MPVVPRKQRPVNCESFPGEVSQTQDPLESVLIARCTPCMLTCAIPMMTSQVYPMAPMPDNDHSIPPTGPVKTKQKKSMHCPRMCSGTLMGYSRGRWRYAAFSLYTDVFENSILLVLWECEGTIRLLRFSTGLTRRCLTQCTVHGGS